MAITVPINAFSDVPRTAGPFQTPYGITSGPGSRVAAYVRASGVGSGDDGFIANNLVATINDGLRRCRPNKGDTVFVLPDHTEDVTTADALDGLVPGCNIVGLGNGSNRPTINWTATAAEWLIDQDAVCISNMILEMAGPAGGPALTVTNAIEFTGDGCCLAGCFGRVSRNSGQKVAIAIEVTTTANDLVIANCDFLGNNLITVTKVINVNGADSFRMKDCIVQARTSAAAVGVLTFTSAASFDMVVEDCIFQNYITSSSSAVTGTANMTGAFLRCAFGILDDATLDGFTVPGDVQMFDCKTTNDAGENGADTTPVSA